MQKTIIQLDFSAQYAGLAPCELILPTMEQLAVSAAQLLKFEFPPLRYRNAFLKLVSQQLVLPKLPKKKLERLPMPVLAAIYQRLWLELLPESRDAGLSLSDLLLTCLLACEDFTEFNLQRLVQEDVQLLSAEDETRLHSYYYQSGFDRVTLPVVLKAHGFTDAWLQELPKASEPQTLFRLYWLSRLLSYALPWGGLLRVSKTQLSLWPRLQHLKKRHDLVLNQLLSEGFSPSVDLEQWRVDALLRVLALIEDISRFRSVLHKPMPEHPPGSSTSLQHAPICTTTLTQTSAYTTLLTQASAQRPYRRVILVEGTTEAILLPVLMSRFARQSGHKALEAMLHAVDLSDIHIVSAGGKNQAVAIYQDLSRLLNLPIFVLLDQDADQAAREIALQLRTQDALYQIEEGEFEDLYDFDLIVETVNRHYQPYPALSVQRLSDILSMKDPLTAQLPGVSPPVGRVAQFKLLWQVLGLESFDKAHFASKMAETLSGLPPDSHTLSPGMQALMTSLFHE